MDLENTTRRLRRRENGMEMASYFHIWMSPGHFHVVLDVASCYLLLLLSHLFKRHASLTQQYAGLQEGRVQRKNN